MGAGKSSISGYPVKNFKLPSITTASGIYDVEGGVLSNDGSYVCGNIIDFPLSFEKNGKLDENQFRVGSRGSMNIWYAAQQMWNEMILASPMRGSYTPVKNSGIQELKKMDKNIDWGGKDGYRNIGNYHPLAYQVQAFLIAHQKGKSSATYNGPAIAYPPIGVNGKSNIKSMVRTKDSLTISLYRSSFYEKRRSCNNKFTSRQQG
jgi:hypothetical protein